MTAKSKSDKILLALLFIYIIYVFCYGIVIKFTISNALLFAIKTYIPEILLIITMVITLLISHKQKIPVESVLIIGYEIIIVVLNILLHGITEYTLYFARDILIPLCACVCYEVTIINREIFEKFKIYIVIFFKIYLLLGCILAIVEQIKGWNWTSIFYTGYSFYGQDNYSKIKIANNMGLLRVPSLSGNFSSFAEYCLICLCFIFSSKKNNKSFFIWYIITAICCILSTNKSVLITLIIITIIMFVYQYQTKTFRMDRLAILLIFMLITMIILFFKNSDINLNITQGFFGGLFQRFVGWNELFDRAHLSELLLPYNAFLYGSGSQIQSVSGIFSYFDNLYFYMLFIQGIIGIFLWIKFIKRLYIQQKQQENTRNALNLLLVLLIMGITSNITQGRAFFTFFLLFMSLGCYFSENTSVIESNKKVDSLYIIKNR